MQDDRWTTKDKLEQFRGVTDLYNSTNANAKEKLSVLRKKQEKEIRNLTAKNRKIRQQYEEILHGEKKNLLPVLHSHPTMQLAFKNLNTAQIEEELKQSIFCKNKELDRLRFKRKNLEDIFLNKKLELAELQKEVEETPENFLWEQELENQLQSVSVKQNAARMNQQAYEKALNILQKDSIRFDEVLEGLRKDLVHQCESILKAVEMGQNVSEELNTLQKEYYKTERSVRANMRQRDRAIRSLKAELDNIRVHGQPSTRESRAVITTTQSSVSVSENDQDPNNVDTLIDMHIKKEIAELEAILDKIKIAAMVHRLEDIIPRMEEQWRQKARLLKQVEQNKEQLESMVGLYSQLGVMLEVTMYHTQTEEVNKLKEERQELKKDIEEEKENLKEAQKELSHIGEQIVYIRTALLTLNLMLDLVYPLAELTSSGTDLVLDVSSEGLDSQALKPLLQPNTDSLSLMEQVTKKVRWLVDQVGTVRTEVKKVPAKFVAESPEERGIEDEADHIVSDMLAELEDMDDPSVPTRKHIKAESQRLLDLYENPKALFQESNLPKYKKHKCF